MAMSLGPDIPKLLTSGDVSPDVKQSASLCLLKLLRTCPEAVPHGEWATRVVHLLNDHHLVSMRSQVLRHKNEVTGVWIQVQLNLES